MRTGPRLRVAAPIVACLGIGLASRRGRGRDLDERLYKAVNSGLRHPRLDRLFSAVTELGSLWAAGTAAGVVAVAGRRRAAGGSLAAAAATWALGQGLKRVFDRPRPYDSAAPGRLLIGRPQGRSWPSSHPAVLVAFVTVASRELDVPRGLAAALSGIAATVAASRVYLGVHYPSDVAGGLLLGRGVAAAWSSFSREVR